MNPGEKARIRPSSRMVIGTTASPRGYSVARAAASVVEIG